MPCFAQVTLGNWEPLGPDWVDLPLAPQRTVLVGRNGGGKSLLLEGFAQAAGQATAWHLPAGPDSFQLLWSAQPASRALSYRFLREAIEPEFGHIPRLGEPTFRWVEECAWSRPREPIFQIRDGELVIPGQPQVAASREARFFLLVNPETGGLPEGVPAEVGLLRTSLKSIQHVRAEFPRSDGVRDSIVLDTTIRKQIGRNSLIPARRMYQLTARLVEWSNASSTSADLARTDFDELVMVGRRIGIWKDVEVTQFSPVSKMSKEQFVTVSVDGVNLGLLSDGTLRMLELLTALLDSSGGVLLIDEPELGIHPGLLARLLAELDAYGQDRQIVIATHSPQVVSWARPDELRLVEREQGQTRVRSLSEQQAARVSAYLEEQGSLGDFVYSGGLDE